MYTYSFLKMYPECIILMVDLHYSGSLKLRKIIFSFLCYCVEAPESVSNEIYTIGNAVAPLVHVYIARGSKIGLKFDSHA